MKGNRNINKTFVLEGGNKLLLEVSLWPTTHNSSGPWSPRGTLMVQWACSVHLGFQLNLVVFRCGALGLYFRDLPHRFYRKYFQDLHF